MAHRLPAHSIKSTIGRASILPKALGLLSRVSARAATPVATRLFETPMQTRRPAREDEWAWSAAHHLVPSPAGSLATWTWGTGPETVLLVHGWSGRGLQLGTFAEPLVDRGCRVVAFDAPGHGSSPGGTSSILHFVEAMAAMADSFGPFAAIVAHSLGATATVLALGWGRLEAGRVAAIAPPSSMAAIIERFGAMTGFTPAVLDRMQRRFAHRLRFSWDDIEPLPMAATLSSPAMIVHDRGDRDVPFADGAALAETWPGAVLVATEGLGHRRPLRDTAVVARVTDFVTPRDPITVHSFTATDQQLVTVA